MEREINIVNIEKEYQDILKIDDYDLKIILEKISKECGFHRETLLGFSEKLYEYDYPPKINNFDNILVNYILKDNKYIAKINLDILTISTNMWDYYIPNEIPKNCIRITLSSNKKVIVDNDKRTKLILPAGQDYRCFIY